MPDFPDFQSADVAEFAPPSLNGWTPPVIYDAAEDTTRIATQADIDQLTEVARRYFQLKRDLAEAVRISNLPSATAGAA